MRSTDHAWIGLATGALSVFSTMDGHSPIPLIAVTGVTVHTASPDLLGRPDRLLRSRTRSNTAQKAGLGPTLPTIARSKVGHDSDARLIRLPR